MEYEPVPEGELGSGRDEVNTVYTGAVYEAQLGACRNLLAAIELLQQPNVRLHVYSAQSPVELGEMGIRGPVVYHEHQALSRVRSVQRQADILFLPLEFTSPYPEIIRTSTPGKTGEYLAARRPILAHAPAGSFLAWYSSELECGLVVDEGDPKKLAEAIERLLTDGGLTQRLSARAWERAQSDFSISTAQSRFWESVKVRQPCRPATRPFGSEFQT
jgi:glycosyltransferase involved in cell wall biosynthesis